MKKFHVYVDWGRECVLVEATRFRKKWMEDDFYFYAGFRRVAFFQNVKKIVEVQDSE